MSAAVQCKAICGGVFVKQVVLCMCVCVCACRCAGLKSATKGLQEEKEKFERDLIPLSQSVNEAKSKVSSSSSVTGGSQGS